MVFKTLGSNSLGHCVDAAALLNGDCLSKGFVARIALLGLENEYGCRVSGGKLPQTVGGSGGGVVRASATQLLQEQAVPCLEVVLR